MIDLADFNQSVIVKEVLKFDLVVIGFGSKLNTNRSEQVRTFINNEVN